MIRELLGQDDIGTLELAATVCKAVEAGPREEEELREYISDANYEIAHSLPGLLLFLSYLGYINISGGKVSLNGLESDTQIIAKLFYKMNDDSALGELLNSKTIDIQSDRIAIRNGAVPAQYSQIRNFLLDSGVLEDPDGSRELLYVNERYADVFRNYVSNKKSLEELKKDLEAKARRGAEAEKFVLEYELRIRQSHPNRGNIRIISEEDAGAGYDIQSYQMDASMNLDKFIEVKSYLSARCFYWTRNERETAQRLGDRYYLYIVDSERLASGEEGYEPEIIENPYERLKDWEKTCETWRYDLGPQGSSEAG